MKKNAIKLSFLTLITAGFLAAPALMHAQDSSTNSADTATAPATPKHAHRGAPFHGTVDGVDTNAMTLTVGSRTFQVTGKTKIMKDGQPATLSDAVIGEKVGGYYRTNADGDLTAATIHFGVNKKHKESSDSTTSTNSASSN